MTNQQLANQVKRLKGKLYASINSQHDCLIIAIEKQDFIKVLLEYPEGEAGFEILQTGKVNYLNN